ncbi:YehR family protein [Oceanobacillus sojae]|uniref:YehR family protein n=1 Tax=Oceanobacillus sojae TaxID=582851 RepID=UPI0021A60738|nr:YehR family protein [Oceanobacillus sojae]MCT1902476.1 YehR family protein [Oceanobacillus sojae]
MKKTAFRITGLLFLLIATLGLAACGSEETVTLKGEQMGMNMEVTLDAKDDEITHQTVKTDVPYSTMMVESKEEAEKMDEEIRAQFAPFDDVEGIEYEIEYGEDYLIQTISVDLTAVDMDELNSIPGASMPAMEDDEYISLEETVKELEDAGLEVVEE